MKIRFDFVTNSSSSGYIIIRLTYRNGESTVLETEWDSGWGDYFSSYGLDDMLHKAKNGVDLLAALRKRIDNWESLVENKTWTADFRKEVASLSSLDSLKSISIEEHDNDPEREEKQYIYRFSAGEKKSAMTKTSKKDIAAKHCDLFDDPKKIQPTFNAACGYYGVFSFGDSDVLNVWDFRRNFLEHGWYCDGHGLRAEAEAAIQWEPNKRKLDYPFYIVGDITTEELDAGQLDIEYRMLKQYKERFGFKLYSESDIIALGKRPFPVFPDVGISSIEGMNVCCVGSFKQSLKKRIIANGGILQKGKPTSATDVLILADEVMTDENLEFFAESRAKDLDRSWELNKKTGKPIMLTESQFLASELFTKEDDNKEAR